ncbi:hypothetical protein LINGRAHAP2_LOCUS16270 [Linum grandiflorum]
MATSTDEFSFPTAASGFESPPLWRLSPAASPHHPHQRRSFSHAAEYTDDAGEKKMDMLWEDFNEEELITTSKSQRVYPVPDRRGSGGVMVDVGCVEGRLRLSPKRSTTTPARMMNSSSTSTAKPGLVVLVRVLKRLFLLHHRHHHKHSATSRRPSPAPSPVKVKVSRSSW